MLGYCVKGKRGMCMLRRIKKAMTLPEVLIALTILAVGLTALVTLYSTSAVSVTRSRNMLVAVRDANTVLENIKATSLSTVKSKKSDSAYWNSMLSNSLLGESVLVYNIDSADASWDNDPLELAVEVRWTEGTAQRNVTIVSKFTE